MKRKEDFPIERHSLNLFTGDFARLQEIAGRMGAGKVVRALVRGYIEKMEKLVNQKLPIPPIEDISVEIPDLKELLG